MDRFLDLTWTGGEHRFLLEIAHLRALQERCDAGPYFIMQRLGTGGWTVDDVIQPIRLGLEGGGMDKAEAARLVRKHVESEPLAQHVLLARSVLQAALLGVARDDEDPVGDEAEAGEAPGETAAAASPTSPEANGGSPISTSARESSGGTSAT